MDVFSTIVLSGLLLAQAVLAYGEGAMFAPAIILIWAKRFRQGRWREVLGAVLCLAAPFAAAVAWWRNVQTLVVGGGLGEKAPLYEVIRWTAEDFLWRNASHYFFSDGRPALGSLWIALLAFVATIRGLRDWRRNWIWLSFLVCGGIVIFVGGGPPGVRRLLPVLIALGTLTILFLRDMTRYSAWAVRGAAVALIAYFAFAAYGYRNDLATGQLALKPDLLFQSLPGLDMEATLLAIRNGQAPVPSDFRANDPQSTLSILYVLGNWGNVVNEDTLLHNFDNENPPIDADEPRFSRLWSRAW